MDSKKIILCNLSKGKLSEDNITLIDVLYIRDKAVIGKGE